MLKIIPQPVAVTLDTDQSLEQLVFLDKQAKALFITSVDAYAGHIEIDKLGAIKALRTLYQYLTLPGGTRLSLLCAKQLIEQGWPEETTE